MQALICDTGRFPAEHERVSHMPPPAIPGRTASAIPSPCVTDAVSTPNNLLPMPPIVEPAVELPSVEFSDIPVHSQCRESLDELHQAELLPIQIDNVQIASKRRESLHVRPANDGLSLTPQQIQLSSSLLCRTQATPYNDSQIHSHTPRPSRPLAAHATLLSPYNMLHNSSHLVLPDHLLS